MSNEPEHLAESRAILIGVSAYDDQEFTQIPAARNSVAGMQRVLTDPALGRWPSEAVTVLHDPATVSDLADCLTDLAETTSGALIVYYVGHGTLSARGELCLTVKTTRRHRAHYTGVQWSTVAQAMRDSPARLRIAILDCCFAGQAIDESLAGPIDAAVADITHIEGVYTLTATTRNHTAHAPALHLQETAPTSFTGALLELVTEGIRDGEAELTLDALYPHLHHLLIKRGLPRPNRRGTHTAGEFVFSHNAAYRSTARYPVMHSPSLSARFIMLIDCSDRMVGHGKISTMNFAVRELLPELIRTASNFPEHELLFQAMGISTEAWWHIPATPVQDVQWPDLAAGGELSLGKALSMLADELSSPAMPTWCLPPTVALFLSSEPTDDWLTGLRRLNDTRWGPFITRLTTGIGIDAPPVTFGRFLGHSVGGISMAHNPQSLVQEIRWIPIRVDHEDEDHAQ